MPDNSKTRTEGQVPSEKLALNLLSLICTVEGNTFSWYSSKKGRNWLACKSNGTPTYTTSVEYSGTPDSQETLDALAVLMSIHFRKLAQVEPPVPTWVNLQSMREQAPNAWEHLKKTSVMFLQHLKDDGMVLPGPIQRLLAECGYTLEVQEP